MVRTHGENRGSPVHPWGSGSHVEDGGMILILLHMTFHMRIRKRGDIAPQA